MDKEKKIRLEQEISDLEKQLLARKKQYEEIRAAELKEAFREAVSKFLAEFNIHTAEDVARVSELLRTAKNDETAEEHHAKRPITPVNAAEFKKLLKDPVLRTRNSKGQKTAEDYVAGDDVAAAMIPDDKKLSEKEDEYLGGVFPGEEKAADSKSPVDDRRDEGTEPETEPVHEESVRVPEDSVPMGEGSDDSSDEVVAGFADAFADEDEEPETVESDAPAADPEPVENKTEADTEEEEKPADADAESEGKDSDDDEDFDWKAFDSLW